MSFFIVSSDLDLEFNCCLFMNGERTWWQSGVKVNVNNTPMTIDWVCKTFCLWTCNLDLVCFEKRVFVYCMKKQCILHVIIYENYN